MAALFAQLWLSQSVTDPVGLTVAKPFRTPNLACSRLRLFAERRARINRSALRRESSPRVRS